MEISLEFWRQYVSIKLGRAHKTVSTFYENNLKVKRSRSSYGKCLGQSLISAATDYLMG